MRTRFDKRLQALHTPHKTLLQRANKKLDSDNGIYTRYLYPVLTSNHTPIFWRYDLNYETNPYLMERFGINAVLNAGAIKLNGKYLVIVRVEGPGRKSFFAVAESPNGIDNFEFWEYPVTIPEIGEADINIYDMRIVQHEDGWLYGVFCTERRDPDSNSGDQAAAIAHCGIARTMDLRIWERLPDLKTPATQQRNVVLHPEFVNGKYAFYTGPQQGFVEDGISRIGYGLSDSITSAIIEEEVLLDQKLFHTVNESKYGLGPAPIKTQYGWLHLAHEVRNTTAGLRYILHMFMTDLKKPTSVIYKPGGDFLAPEEDERGTHVSNVVFCNGWITDDDGTVYIYYASSATHLCIATTTVDQLLDYVMNSSPDGLSAARSVSTLCRIIDNNKALKQLKHSTKEKSVK